MKTCPFCAEEIKAEAIKCKHCGSMLEEVKTQTVDAEIEEPKGKAVISTLIIVCLIAAIAAIAIFSNRDTEGPTMAVGSFMVEVKKDNFSEARSYLTSDYSKTLSDRDLQSLAKKMNEEFWIPNPDSIVIDGNKAVEQILAIKGDSFTRYTVRLEKTFWGWKITGIH